MYYWHEYHKSFFSFCCVHGGQSQAKHLQSWWLVLQQSGSLEKEDTCQWRISSNLIQGEWQVNSLIIHPKRTFLWQLSRYSSLLYGFYMRLSLYDSEGWIISQLANFAKVFLLDVILNLLLIFVGVLNLLQWLISRLASEWRTVQCSCWPGNCFFWKTTITFVIQLT